MRALGSPHQGHQRQEPGRGAVPEGRQRHRGRGQPGRQAQGRGLRLPRDLAPRHRGVPRAAQEHRRRPPPHARHEHGQLDPRPVHEARDGRRRVDAVLALRRARPARQVRHAPSRRPTPRYEEKAARGELKLFKKVPAADLWRKMLSMLFETGHPWITFKDACNVRSPAAARRRRALVATCAPRSRSTPAPTEIAVCNLGSVNLAAAPRRTASSTTTSCKKTIAHRDADARQRHRHQLLRGQEGARLQPAPPPGRPGHHGLPGLPVRAARAVRVARRRSSSPTARWKRSATTPTGPRPSSPRSAAATRSYQRLAVGPRHPAAGHARAARRGARRLRRGRPLGDAGLGRRCASASRSTACATPTASPSRRRRRSPTSSASSPRSSRRFQNLFVKSNLSGEFTVVNEYLVRDLKKRGPVGRGDGHGPEALRRLAARGSTACPQDLKRALRHRVRDRADSGWSRPAARRQKWIDQAQSLNIYMAGASGKKLDETYKLAWLRGLKTTYYLRTHGRDPRREVDGASRASSTRCRTARAAARRRRREQRRSTAPRSSDAARERRQVLRDRRPGVRSVSVTHVRRRRARVNEYRDSTRSRCNRATQSKRRESICLGLRTQSLR